MICDQSIRLERFLRCARLSRAHAAHPLQGSRIRQEPDLPDQQHDAAALDHSRAVQEPLAGRAVLQVDQAAPAHQAISRHKRERGEDANLVRRLHIRAHRHRQKGASTRCLALHVATDSFGLRVRENRDFMRLAARSITAGNAAIR